VEDLHRLSEVLVEQFHGRADVLAEAARVVVGGHPHKAAKADLGADLTQACIVTVVTVLIARLAARDVRAIALGVKGPGVKDAGDALGIARVTISLAPPGWLKVR
jgi:predicted NBD/HSP70 family sugar kinase